MKEKLNQKEQLFCQYYACTRNGREAAVQAGYHMFPQRTALKLMDKESIQTEIQRYTTQRTYKNEVATGLHRLAFGSIADAIKLLYGEVMPDVEALDLFNISEIKRPKAGGVEIKFFDRLKALERLASLTQEEESESAVPFYKALERSGKKIASVLEDKQNVH